MSRYLSKDIAGETRGCLMDAKKLLWLGVGVVIGLALAGMCVIVLGH